MTRDEFMIILDRELDQAEGLFTRKNKSYGDQNQVFYNFQETARRVFDDTSCGSMWKVMYTYMDKHMVALTNGITEREFVERLRDIVVYSLLGIALHAEHEVIETLKWEADQVLEKAQEING